VILITDGLPTQGATAPALRRYVDAGDRAKLFDEAVRGINKVREGRPHIVDIMKNGEIQLVINTTDGAEAIADSFSIRSTSLTAKIPYTTTISGGLAIASALEAMAAAPMQVEPLQNYF
jgi:carbamoyl-phosphate synthase large subunit